MKKRWLLNSLAISLVAGQQVFASTPWSPAIIYSGRRVVARPAADHRPLAQAIYVAETEECSASAASSTQLEVSDRCKYLRGLYRYIYQPEGNVPKRQLVVGFSLTRSGATSHAFLVNEPIEVEETALTP